LSYESVLDSGSKSLFSEQISYSLIFERVVLFYSSF
jgi:hypothetical protein